VERRVVTKPFSFIGPDGRERQVTHGVYAFGNLTESDLMPNLYEERARRAQVDATDAINRAVTGWAKQVDMTVERWLELYEPHLEHVLDEDKPNTITWRVTAHLKGTPQAVFRRPPR
jgi:hypothetical protein